MNDINIILDPKTSISLGPFECCYRVQEPIVAVPICKGLIFTLNFKLAMEEVPVVP